MFNQYSELIRIGASFNYSCRLTSIFQLTVAIPQDPPNYPSLLTLKRFRLTHAGDNFPGLQRQIISDVFEKPNRLV